MKKLLLTTIVLCLAVSTAWTQKFDFTTKSRDNTLYYKITNNSSNPKTVALEPEFNYNDDYKTYDTPPSGTLIIPNIITHDSNNYSVTSIGDNAFYDCSDLTGSLTIPDGIKSIGASAFANCTGLNGALIIGDSVTSIGDGAFNGCYSFSGSLTIPNAVKSIGNNAFSGSLTIGIA